MFSVSRIVIKVQSPSSVFLEVRHTNENEQTERIPRYLQ